MNDVDVWDRYRPAWHLPAVAVPVLVGALICSDGSIPPPQRLLAGVALLISLLWYTWKGVPAVNHRDDQAGLLYLAGALVFFAGTLAVSMAAMFLLSVLPMQVFTMLQRWRHRLAALGGIALIITGGAVRHIGLSTDTWIWLAVTGVAPVLMAALLGAYISALISQSRARSGLIAELRATRAELAIAQHAAGVVAERERLSAEIHDTLAQGFTSILMLAQSARVSRSPDLVGDKLDLIERTARENLAEARSLVAALSPPDLRARSLAEALLRLAERHTRDTGVPVTVDVAPAEPAIGPSGAAPDGDAVLLRAAQEALTNVRRHAGASTVRIVLSSRAVTVIDDGQGFDPLRRNGGYGLNGLRSRVLGFGGTCTVESAPGVGTTVHVDLPAPLLGGGEAG